MQFYSVRDTAESADKIITKREYRQKLETSRNKRKSYFLNKDLYDQISSHRMQRPKGKIYKG